MWYTFNYLPMSLRKTRTLGYLAMVLFVAACQNEQASYENTQPFTRKSFKETKALKGQVLNYADIFDPVKVRLPIGCEYDLHGVKNVCVVKNLSL